MLTEGTCACVYGLVRGDRTAAIELCGYVIAALLCAAGGWGGLDAKLLSYLVVPEDVEICKHRHLH